LAVLAQRLVRKVCSNCCEERPATTEELNFLGESAVNGTLTHLKHGRGCPNCRDTGYRGRIGLFELLTVTDPVRLKIQSRANASDIRDTGLAGKMKLLRHDGALKVQRGATTVDEVSRVTVRATT
jgi:type II secretory ATPase GspE/PulE/Tfp pilus assembly ATPase PilB-like protein